MNIAVSLIDSSEKERLIPLLRNYLWELQASTDYPYLNSYWTETNRIPLKLTNNYQWQGFAFINDYTLIPTNTISVAEFYILPEYRNQGLGTYFAQYIFNSYKGNWEVRQHVKNTKATSFWRNTIANYTEVYIDNEIIQSFSNLNT